MSPETPSKTTKDISFKSLFGFDELIILSSLPKKERDAIIEFRLNASEKTIFVASHTERKEEKTIPQKQGEPNWKDVEHDAKIELGKKILGER